VNHWAFVIAAYGVALAGAGVLAAWSFVAMRRAEREAGRR